MLSAELEFCLNEAFQKARSSQHEFLTVEHLLLKCNIQHAYVCRLHIVLDKEKRRHMLKKNSLWIQILLF